MEENLNGRPREITVSYKTLFKVIAVLLFILAFKALLPLIMSLFFGILIAVSLEPGVRRLQRRGVKRSYAISIVAISMILFVGIVIGLIAPRLSDEVASFVSNLPKLKESFLSMLPSSGPINSWIENAFSPQNITPKPGDIMPIFSAGNIVLGGLAEIILIFVFSIYLLIEGQQVLDWISAFFSEPTQEKIKQTVSETSVIISAYVAGQFITSLLCSIFVLIVLSSFSVPNALLLAVLAGIFDILPVIGFFLAVIPTLLVAMSVSMTTALFIFLIYSAYHLLENYYIVPLVYGSRLRVSGFVILLTLIAAALVGGIKGALAALPIVASYPIIERVWLTSVLRSETISEHARSPVK